MFERWKQCIRTLLGRGDHPSLSDQLKEQLMSLPHHYSQFDVVMAWDIRTVDGNSVIDGVIKNVRYSTMNGLEVWVMTMDSMDKEISRSMDFVIPHSLKLDDIATFSVKLPMKVASGTKQVISYSYDGLDGSDGTHWMQSFEFVVP